MGKLTSRNHQSHQTFEDQVPFGNERNQEIIRFLNYRPKLNSAVSWVSRRFQIQSQEVSTTFVWSGKATTQ